MRGRCGIAGKRRHVIHQERTALFPGAECLQCDHGYVLALGGLDLALGPLPAGEAVCTNHQQCAASGMRLQLLLPARTRLEVLNVEEVAQVRIANLFPHCLVQRRPLLVLLLQRPVLGVAHEHGDADLLAGPRGQVLCDGLREVSAEDRVVAGACPVQRLDGPEKIHQGRLRLFCAGETERVDGQPTLTVSSSDRLQVRTPLRIDLCSSGHASTKHRDDRRELSVRKPVREGLNRRERPGRPTLTLPTIPTVVDLDGTPGETSEGRAVEVRGHGGCRAGSQMVVIGMPDDVDLKDRRQRHLGDPKATLPETGETGVSVGAPTVGTHRLEEKPVSDEHNVFMPHRHEDDRHIEQIKNLLARHGCRVRDSSVDSSSPNRAKDPDYIKGLLANSIRWAGKIIVLVSPQTKDHDWVDWEVQYASRFPDKRIIGVWLPGADSCDLPEALERHADAVVSWDAAQIVAAIEGADNWQRPDGSPTPPRAIRRLAC